MATIRGKRTAKRLARDLDDLESHGAGAAARIGNVARAAAARAMVSGSDPSAAAMSIVSSDLVPLLIDAMIAAHLRGRNRVLLAVAPALKAAGLRLSAYDGAIEFLEKRLKTTPAQLGQLTKLYGPAATKSLGGASAKLERNIRKAVADAAAHGEHLAAGVGRVRAAFDAAGFGSTAEAKPHMIEAIFRTQTQLAFAAGRENAWADEAIDEILWGWEYVTVGDDRVRPEHEALDGMRLPKDDPKWLTMSPPNGWNCRCQKIEIFVDERIATPKDVPDIVEIGGVEVRGGPDPGFAFNPGDLFADTMAVGQ